ncbi:MAG: hypothetical protein ABSD47_20145 [Candidatus Methylomirabilota bacterium]|jgi:hypothetical protein
MAGGRQGHPGNGRGTGVAERQIIGNPAGTVAVHPVESVAVRVDLDPWLSVEDVADHTHPARTDVP